MLLHFIVTDYNEEFFMSHKSVSIIVYYSANKLICLLFITQLGMKYSVGRYLLKPHVLQRGLICPCHHALLLEPFGMWSQGS